jgi:hypothetical protein
MIREVVAAGTAAATVSTNGGHALVLRVALATVTQVAVTAAAVVYGAYLSPYADGILRRGTTKDETPFFFFFFFLCVCKWMDMYLKTFLTPKISCLWCSYARF